MDSTTTPPPPRSTKGLILKRAFKSARRLPVPKGLGLKSGSGRNNFSPTPGEHPVVICKIQIIGCTQLLAKDRNGASDPFVVVSVLSTRQQTPVAKRTLNPVYNPKDATFEFPLYLSLADKLGGVELVVWDKDMLSKEYLGEVALSLESWFRGEGEEIVFGFDEPGNKPFSVDLLSTRANTVATGSIQLKIGFIPPHGTRNLLEFDEIYREFVKRSRPSLVSAPPTEGVGTIRSHHAGKYYAFQDDGGLSSDDEDDDEEGEDEFVDANEDQAAATNVPLTEIYSPSPTEASLLVTTTGIKPPPPELIIQPSSPSTTPTPSAALKTATPLTQPTPKATGFMPKMKFTRKISGLTGIGGGGGGEGARSPSRSSSPVPLPASPIPSSPALGVDGDVGKKKRFTSRKGSEAYRFEAEANDVVGIVMLEIQGAVDLPRFKNMTRTGWDMDPFVVVSFGKKVFRTRVIRHSRNPVWDEKLLFHVRRYETSFKVNLAILDWDKLSSNDYVGDVSFDVRGLMESAPQPDPGTGLYAVDEGAEGGEHPMVEYKLPLVGNASWEGKYSPILSFRAKYQPYDALRQRFWRQYLKQYDTDDTGSLSHLELTSMLDSLGSTLSRSTVSSFFTRHGKKAESDELSFEQAISCLEDELGRPVEEKRRVDDADLGESCVPTPVLTVADGQGNELKFEEMDFSKDQTDAVAALESWDDTSDDPLSSSGGSGNVSVGGGAGTLLPPEEKKKKKSRFRRGDKSSSSSSDPANKKKSKSKPKKNNSGDNSELESEDSVERVINVKSCPLCHRPRMNSKAEMDIITHLAVCASRDWSSVDKIVVGNFVTASQAQRKWYTRVIGKISSGDYKLGANSANIIVQNRVTGQLEEEKMQVYVRLGIRLLYKGASSRMEGARARRLLKSLSIKQGVKYDAPESAREIPVFIEFHKLKVDEILDPLDSFKTFNEFFYRKLKPSARPIESLDNPYRLVSGADCRMMAFETVSEATRLWIKGREFTVARLLGENYKQEAERYTGGALAIFRLAPQDYHRFHSPVEGTIGNMTEIAGEYYTVNPQAIRTALDVYGENARKIVPIDSPHFGRVMAVCVGAMMVGSIKTTVEEGQYVQRGEEFGYFAFGGSTIVLLFEKGKVEWDEDLLINGRASLETLVRFGMGIGKGRPAVPGAV